MVRESLLYHEGWYSRSWQRIEKNMKPQLSIGRLFIYNLQESKTELIRVRNLDIHYEEISLQGLRRSLTSKDNTIFQTKDGLKDGQ